MRFPGGESQLPWATRPPRAILVVKPSAIGDVAQSLFALPALRRAFPDAVLGWVASRGCDQLLVDNPLLDRLHVFERQAWRDALRRRQEILSFAAGLRRERYELAIDLQGLARSALVTMASGARWRAGFTRAREGAPLAYNLRYDSGLEVQHAIDRYRGLLARVGAPWQEPHEPTASGAEHETARTAEAADAALAPLAGRRPLVAMQTSSSWPTKRWSIERFIELARRLEAAGVALVLLGSDEDRPDTARILEAAPGSLDLAGRSPLRLLAALLRRVDLFVTCDSGPMHIAAAVGTPTVALFGPTDSRRTGPYGPGHEVLQAGVECAPCFSRTCRVGDLRCQDRLGIEQVEGAVWRQLGSQRTGSFVAPLSSSG